MGNPGAPSTRSDTISRRFYHGTRADLTPGDVIYVVEPTGSCMDDPNLTDKKELRLIP